MKMHSGKPYRCFLTHSGHVTLMQASMLKPSSRPFQAAHHILFMLFNAGGLAVAAPSTFFLVHLNCFWWVLCTGVTSPTTPGGTGGGGREWDGSRPSQPKLCGQIGWCRPTCTHKWKGLKQIMEMQTYSHNIAITTMQMLVAPWLPIAMWYATHHSNN